MQNRWIILAASVVINLCIGSAYAWSVFQTPFIEQFGWSTADASLAFTLSLSLVPFAMIVAGRFMDVRGPKIVAFTGGIIFSVGMFLTSFTNSLTILYLTYGILGGWGIGTVYSVTVSNTVKWFPDKRGLAGGFTAAGFGLGAVLFAPVAVSLVGSFGVLTTFKILGVFHLVVILATSLLLSAPTAGWKPEGWNPPQPAGGSGIEDYTSKQMLKTPDFYLLWAMYTIGCVSGLMIIGHASSIGQEVIGLTPQVAAVAVSFLGLANTFGRMFWGTISDKLGRYITLVLMYLTSGIMLLILNIAQDFTLFVVGVCGIALGFGGFLGIFPSVTADKFGAKYLSVNYGIIFTAYGLAAFIGPRLAAVVKESSGGDYGLAFIIASVMNVVGIIFTLIIANKIKKEKASLNM